MSNAYRNQPISGFTGYIPGAKWQVGSRFVPQPITENHNPSPKSNSHGNSTENERNSGDAKNESASKNFADMSNDEIRERMMRLQMDMQQLQFALDSQHGEEAGRNVTDSMYRETRRTEHESNPEGRSTQTETTTKQRSRSVPRRVENNPFDGIESGWWSKGEVQRNKERRQIANGGHMVSGGNWSQRPPSQQRATRRIAAVERDEADDIPTAGYSGHIQGMRQLGVGKPFNLAAKQAKKEYLERRRTYSGSREALNNQLRGVQYSDDEVLSNTVKLPSNRF